MIELLIQIVLLIVSEYETIDYEKLAQRAKKNE